MSALIKIYKIISPSTPSVYVGSTKEQLSRRFNGHKKSYRHYQEGRRANMSSFDILKHGDAKIELVKEVDEADRDEEEYKVQQNTQHCINKYDPRKYKATRPIKTNQDYVFTEREQEKIDNSPTDNAKYVLRNYYRHRADKLRQSALKRITLTGRPPTNLTIEKYNITAQEIATAIRAAARN